MRKAYGEGGSDLCSVRTEMAIGFIKVEAIGDFNNSSSVQWGPSTQMEWTQDKKRGKDLEMANV